MAGFNEMINGSKPVLVDFFAELCGPCKMMAPILKQAKDQLGDAVTILKIDIDKNPDTARYYNIQGVPTLLLFQHGQVRWRQSGVVPAPELVRTIRSHITT